MKIVENRELRAAEVPDPSRFFSEVTRFARLYDGYGRFSQSDPGRELHTCSRLAGLVYERYLASGELPDSLDDLRTCLFFEDSRRRKELDPRQHRDAYINSLLVKIKRLIAAPAAEEAGAPHSPAGGLSDSVGDYRRLIRRLIEGYAEVRLSVGDVQVETIFDEQNDHYELIYSGWQGRHRIHGPVVHVDIRGDKIWIQHDGTHDGMANDLVEAGVPKDQIVLAFRPPDVRPLTGFATA